VSPDQEQLVLGGFESCTCWLRVDPDSAVVLAGYSCPECVERALAYLEDLLYVDRVVSVSAMEAEAEEWLTSTYDSPPPFDRVGGSDGS